MHANLRDCFSALCKKVLLQRVPLLLIAALCALPGHAATVVESALDTPLPQFKASPGSELWTLCQLINRPCGMEEAKFGDLSGKGVTQAMSLSEISPRKILDEIAKRYPSYRWSIQNEVIVLEPKSREGEDLLSKRIASLSIRGDSSFKAALDVLHHAGIRFSYQMMGRVPTFGQIDLDIKDVTARDALNSIAKLDGQVLWMISPRSDSKKKGSISFMMPSWRKSGVRFSMDERKKVKY